MRNNLVAEGLCLCCVAAQFGEGEMEVERIGSKSVRRDFPVRGEQRKADCYNISDAQMLDLREIAKLLASMYKSSSISSSP